MPKLCLILITLFLLTGCWNAEEIDSTALAHGVGLDKAGDKIKVSLEIIRPTPMGGTNAGESEDGGHNIILESEVDTLLTGVRAMIRTSKRRLHFEHARVFIIGDELAKEDAISQIDSVRRDQMFRLGSYLFVTENDPAEILETPTLYEHLTSLELSDAMEETLFTTGYLPVNVYQFFAMLEGVIGNAYLPMISLQEIRGEKSTALNGTAIFKEGKMVGRLTINETIGLNWLVNKVEGGSITITLNNKQKGSVRIKKAKTKFIPKLEGNHLQADVFIDIVTDFVDNPLDVEIDEDLINDIKRKVSRKVESDVSLALKKLQGELKTDVTQIGLATYRKYPRRWAELAPQWNEIFATADINVQVDVKILHTGKINENLNRERKKPANNPYLFPRSGR